MIVTSYPNTPDLEGEYNTRGRLTKFIMTLIKHDQERLIDREHPNEFRSRLRNICIGIHRRRLLEIKR